MLYTHSQVQGDRVFGLDLMRALAILLVVAVHAGDLLDLHWPNTSVLSGIDGVDVFFVLSGYLIGGILLRYMYNNSVPWHERLFDFWRRRWLRTLPNYYLFLVVNVLLLHWGLAPGLLNVNALAYFAMLQNLVQPLDLFFWESWSLAVEEWFYVLFPLLLIMIAALLRKANDKVFLFAILVFLVVPVLLRVSASEGIHDMRSADLYIRRIVLTRLDTIGYGLLGAWLHRRFARQWRAWRISVCLLGTVLLAWATTLHGMAPLLWSMTGQHALMAVGIGMMLPLLSTWLQRPSWGAPVTTISKLSYAWYLVHMPLHYQWENMMVDRGRAATLLLYFAYWAVGIAISALAYRFWERPWMELRERWVRKEHAPIGS